MLSSYPTQSRIVSQNMFDLDEIALVNDVIRHNFMCHNLMLLICRKSKNKKYPSKPNKIH